jgi:casein kinase II subunit alpha
MSLMEMIKVLGSDSFLEFVNERKILVPEDVAQRLERKRYHRRDWKDFIDLENHHLCSVESLSLLNNLLLFAPERRMTATEVLEHEYFRSTRLLYKALMGK